MRSSNQATLRRAVGRLGVLAGPILLAYIALGAILVVAVDSCLRPLILVALLLGLLALVRSLYGSLVKVPPGYAMLVEERWGQGVYAWLGGWHVCPPGFYNCRAPMPLWPRNRERVLENVTVGGSPPVTLKVTYTIRPAVPREIAVLPRRGAAGPLPTDKKVVSNIYFMAAAAEAWDQDSGDLLENALRVFFGARPGAQIYDLAGAGPITPRELYATLNTELGAIFADYGYEIRVRTVQALHMEGPGAAVWQQRVLQELLGVIQPLPAAQALAAGDVFRAVSGRVPSGLDPGVLLLMQMLGGQGGPPPFPPGVPPSGPQRPASGGGAPGSAPAGVTSPPGPRDTPAVNVAPQPLTPQRGASNHEIN